MKFSCSFKQTSAYIAGLSLGNCLPLQVGHSVQTKQQRASCYVMTGLYIEVDDGIIVLDSTFGWIRGAVRTRYRFSNFVGLCVLVCFVSKFWVRVACFLTHHTNSGPTRLLSHFSYTNQNRVRAASSHVTRRQPLIVHHLDTEYIYS